MINIRIATEKDLPGIFGLVNELAVYEKAADQVTTSIESYERDFNANIFEAIVAEKDGEIAGMALFYMAYSTWRGRMLYLEDFVVKEEFRRFGIGQLLFDAFVKVAKEKEASLVKWQVLDWNEPAIKFYEKNKATIEKEWWNGKIIFNGTN
jgi:GNAT superfamily N-acetyltransferase